jgi:hypothetical protein
MPFLLGLETVSSPLPSVPKAAGHQIVRCVTQRKIKIDPATGGLGKRNAFKARHCVDGGHQQTLLERNNVASK